MSRNDDYPGTNGPPNGGSRPSTAVDNGGNGGPENPNIEDLLDKLDALEATVDDDIERRKVQQTRAMVERMPGSTAFKTHISKYTSRDVAESAVGAIIFSLPLLVEDGVFEIAEWLVGLAVGSIPVFFVVNALFIIGLTAGLLYAADFREVQVSNPILGLVPRRLVGVLGVSLLVAFWMMFMWGRLHADDPTTMEQIARVTVIWAAAAFGAAVGDILPGESKGEDLSDMFD